MATLAELREQRSRAAREVLERLREGQSLTSASKAAGTTPRTAKKYLQQGRAIRKVEGHYRPRRSHLLEVHPEPLMYVGGHLEAFPEITLRGHHGNNWMQIQSNIGLYASGEITEEEFKNRLKIYRNRTWVYDGKRIPYINDKDIVAIKEYLGHDMPGFDKSTIGSY